MRIQKCSVFEQHTARFTCNRWMGRCKMLQGAQKVSMVPDVVGKKSLQHPMKESLRILRRRQGMMGGSGHHDSASGARLMKGNSDCIADTATLGGFSTDAVGAQLVKIRRHIALH